MATTSLGSFPQPEELECPSCKGVIKLYDPRGSEYCVCDHCHSFLQFVNEKPLVIKVLAANALSPVIPLGTAGTLKDISFKVIGYMERKEKDTDYHWAEYVLYNHEKGYATLSEFDGHWNLIFGENFLPELETVKDYSTAVNYLGTNYKLYHKYTPHTTGASGEFDWNVLAGDINTAEFIAPPFIIAKESTFGSKKKQHEYYRGEYMEPETIAAAFSLDSNLFYAKNGIISNQPSAAYGDLIWSFRFTMYMALAMMIAALMVEFIKPAQILFEDSFSLTYDPDKGPYEFKPLMTPSFEVKDASSFLEIGIRSEVQNNWLETTIVLVNEATNQTWEVTKGVEHYSGIEDGERWTEGETTAKVLLSEIAGGKYHFNIYPASGDPARDSLGLRVTANGTLWRNVFVSLLLIFLFPLINYFRMAAFEKKRWSYSDYSPFDK